MGSRFMDHLSERIKHARTAVGMSQSELADAVSEVTGRNVLKGTVSAWENGRVENPTAVFMLAIQSVTGFRAEWLQHGTLPQRVTKPRTSRPAQPQAQTPALDQKVLVDVITDVLRTEQDPAKAARLIARRYQARHAKTGK